MARVEPWPYTLRELIAGNTAKRTYDYDHTCELMGLIASVQTGKPYGRDHFHPLRVKQAEPMKLDDPGKAFDELTQGKGN